MKEQAVVISLTHELEEVVAMEGCFVEQRHHKRAHRCLKLYTGLLGRAGLRDDGH